MMAMDSQMMTDLNDSMKGHEHGMYVGYAIVLCFLLSIIFSFILALIKCIKPEKKIAGIVVGTFVFNLLYLPGFGFLGSLFMANSYLALLIYHFLFSPIGVIMLLFFVAMFFIATLVLLNIGMIKGKRRKKIIPPQDFSQTPQSSQHPQS